ncbi:site-specific integrase [Tenacibaculum singaporense]|uniref:Site-specific integrase n=1 Tax=Tenacibaculum singaporense TaxID=2358479 RepID=A0A3Q8RS24_9FLAO|nr:site-specific integrase [Tenacibaculum singaporense]AZJ35813.1 site-specific integrase [Tenacibaculum singaporense]
MFKIKRITYSNNQQEPILFYNNSLVYIALKYLTISLKSKSYKTKYNYIYELKKVLEYSKKYYDDIFEKILIINPTDINELSGLIDSYCIYSYSYLLNNQYSLSEYNMNLHRLEYFMIWFIENTKQNSISEINFIKRIFIKNKIKVKSNRTYKSITKDTYSKLTILLEKWYGGKNNDIRNYIIVCVFLETGIRLSELLKIKTTDFIREENIVYLSINNNTNFLDNRVNRPNLKNHNSTRTIGISLNLYKTIDDYIQYYREKTKSHNYLFVNSFNGNPLSKSSVNQLFVNISKQLNDKITPHLLRHYFSEQLLKFLIEIKGIEMDRAKDELRVIGGWTTNSLMPNLYARNYLNKLANDNNIRRIYHELP